jgi:hypothetical protein
MSFEKQVKNYIKTLTSRIKVFRNLNLKQMEITISESMKAKTNRN